MSSVDEFSQSVGAAAEKAETALTSILAAKSAGDELAGQLAAVGLEGKAGRTTAIAQRLGAEAAASAAGLKSLLEELRQEIEGLKGDLQGGGSSPRTATDPAPAVQGTNTSPARPSFKPAGEWSTPPKRTFGNAFNAEYEEWIKTSNGGPAGELEYRVVDSTGRTVWFDAQRIEDTGNGKVEYLLDAKGKYGQFVDPATGDFKKFFREFGGLDSLLDQAGRQVRIAKGRPVEWWCADEAFADALNDRFDRDINLSGKIDAIFKPMP